MMEQENMIRIAVIVPDDMLMRLKYWSGKHDITPSRYLADAVKLSVDWDSSDHKRVTQEISRVNEAADYVQSISDSVSEAQRTIIPGFDAVLSAIRGENYYLHEFDGDINPIMPK